MDECHLLPKKGMGMYRRFIADLMKIAPWCKIIGLTATPYRLDSGLLTEGDDKIFDEIIYKATVKRLVDEGYLCRLIGKTGIVKPDVSKVKKRGGDFIEHDLAEVCDDAAIIRQAVTEIIELTPDRHHIILFCVTIKHAEHVAEEMTRQGMPCAVIHSEKTEEEKRESINGFRDGSIRSIANVNILTTGFDAPHVDCIVMLRPTASPGLYSQSCGRGLRLHPDKENCLILDYAGNILRHGPIDKIVVTSKGVKTAEMKACPACDEAVERGILFCPYCGYEWPVISQGPRALGHDGLAHDVEPLSKYQAPETLDVLDINYYVHEKNNRLSMKVSYVHGPLLSTSEWICIEHEGYAEQKARQWLKSALPEGHPIPDTVEECMEITTSFRKPVQIIVDYNERFPRIKGRIYPDPGEEPEAEAVPQAPDVKEDNPFEDEIFPMSNFL